MGRSCNKFMPAQMTSPIKIQRRSGSSDGQGGQTETWADIASVWAWIRPVKGYERFQAAQVQTPITHKITIHYRSDVTTATRIKFGTRIFNIKEVLNPDEANYFLEIIALETA